MEEGGDQVAAPTCQPGEMEHFCFMTTSPGFQIKRVYDAPTANDGLRVLVDRLWPRGVRKDALPLTEWNRDVAPSTELRKWFDHEPAKWTEFRRRYRAELENHRAAWSPLLRAATADKVTLLYAAKDPLINHAVVLREFLEEQRRAS